MKEIKLIVNGMACTGCENGIKNALGNIDGINSVDANHETGEVNISLTDESLLDEIIEVITSLGYEVESE